MPKPVYAEIYIREKDDFERAIKKFSKRVKKEGIIEEVLRRRFYEKPSEKRNRKKNMKKRREKLERKNKKMG